MELGMGIFFIILAFIYKFFLEEKHTPSIYLEEEADRYFNKRSERTPDWNSNGKSHTKGFALVKINENEYKFITQSKLCDASILS